MKSTLLRIAFFLLPLFFAGCSTTSTGKIEHGPHDTIAYYIQIEASDPGARIEINNDYVGDTPMKVKVFGDEDGTFHNFGSKDYVIKVFPVKPGQSAQTKWFKTGGWWSQEDKIPSRLYFDLNEKAEGFSVDLTPDKSHP